MLDPCLDSILEVLNFETLKLKNVKLIYLDERTRFDLNDGKVALAMDLML